MGKSCKNDLSKIQNWNNFPHVQLKKELYRYTPGMFGNFQDVTYTLYDLERIETNQTIWQTDPVHNYPAHLGISYRQFGFKVEIYVTWDHENNRFVVHLVTPETELYFPTGAHGKPRTYNCKTIDGTILRIENAVMHASKEIDKKKIEQDKHDAVIAAERIVTDKIIDELGLNYVTRIGRLAPDSRRFCYADGTNFSLTFQCLKAREDTFSIKGINVDLTIDEVREIIKISCGSPRAIADRMKRSKG